MQSYKMEEEGKAEYRHRGKHHVKMERTETGKCWPWLKDEEEECRQPELEEAMD